MTVGTTLQFAGFFFKYHVVPIPIKFVFFLLSSALRSVLQALLKRYVLLSAQLDVRFDKSRQRTRFRESGGQECSFSRALALQRLHCRRSVAEDIKTWWQLSRA